MSAVQPMKREARPSAGGLPSRELQELWFATRRRDWRSLVLVPASPGESAMPIAQALGEVGGVIRMGPVQVLNAEKLDLSRIATLVMDMTAQSLQPASPVPGRAAPPLPALIVVIEPVVENPLVLPVALAADAVLLVVRQGETDIAAARHTIELIGRDRLIGAVLLRP